MAPSDRLSELREQRTLVEQHLAWLNREIASAEAQAKTSASAPSTQQADVAPRDQARAAPGGSAEVEAEAILSQYRASPSELERDVRKGCFIYVAIASIATLAGIAVLYFALRH